MSWTFTTVPSSHCTYIFIWIPIFLSHFQCRKYLERISGLSKSVYLPLDSYLRNFSKSTQNSCGNGCKTAPLSCSKYQMSQGYSPTSKCECCSVLLHKIGSIHSWLRTKKCKGDLLSQKQTYNHLALLKITIFWIYVIHLRLFESCYLCEFWVFGQSISFMWANHFLFPFVFCLHFWTETASTRPFCFKSELIWLSYRSYWHFYFCLSWKLLKREWFMFSQLGVWELFL